MHEKVHSRLQNDVKHYFDFLINYLPEDLRELATQELYIAGGLIRSLILGENIKDVDVWFKSDKLIEKIKKLNLGFTSQNAVSFYINNIQYQLIFSRTQLPNDLVNEFDFTMNQNYYDPSQGLLYVGDYNSIATKQLVVSKHCRNALGTLARVSKFSLRGYKVPSRDDLLRLGVLISKTPINTFEQLEDHSKLFFSEVDYNNVDYVNTSGGFTHIDSKPLPYSKTKSGAGGGYYI